MNKVVVRGIESTDLDAVAHMHQQILHDEFIVRFGLGFLKRYYRAFAESPDAVALVAVDEATNSISGALLGTLAPSLHYRYLTRRHGIYFAGIILLQSLLHFTLAKDLLQTRAKRYIQGILRSLRKKGSEDLPRSAPEVPRVSDITHIFVNQEIQSNGVGSALIHAYKTMAQAAGVECIDLVTAPSEMNGAGAFYEKLGWTLQRTHVSQSGEHFLLYRLQLQGMPEVKTK